MRDRDPLHLHPAMLPLLHNHRLLAAEDPEIGPTEMIETWRAPSTQDADFAKGRDAQGNIIDKAAVVTFKKGGLSWHNLTRMMLRCPDGPHESRDHIAGAGGRIAACSSQGFNLGEGCICAIGLERLHNAGTWVEVPASLAYHLALRCHGCHPPGNLIGFGPHGRLSDEDVAHYGRLADLGRSIGLRAGYDWQDYTHFEASGVGTLEQVRAVLSIKGGDLAWPKAAAGGLRT